MLLQGERGTNRTHDILVTFMSLSPWRRLETSPNLHVLACFQVLRVYLPNEAIPSKEM